MKVVKRLKHNGHLLEVYSDDRYIARFSFFLTQLTESIKFNDYGICELYTKQ